MSFISYAQNAEDVMLWRALRHIRNGFYIDVGANDPVIDSVTKAFYDRGWRGINIEPVPRHYDDLVAQRPEDSNLQLAAGAEPGFLTLYEVKEVRGWGTLDAAVAEQYRQQGHQLIELPVTVTPLSEICRAQVCGEIHFLKIDVEGAEEQVLRGMDFNRWRPWIVIAESRIPTEGEAITAAWESHLTAAGYAAIYFDGINTFYLADEHRHTLQQAFHAPPNILDDFVRASEWESGRYAEKLEKHYADQRQHSRQLEAALQQANQQVALQQQQLARWNAREQEFSTSEQRIAAQEQQIAAQEQQIAAQEQQIAAQEQQIAAQQQQIAAQQQQIAAQEQQIAALYASSSWKVTAPLRAAGRLVGGLKA